MLLKIEGLGLEEAISSWVAKGGDEKAAEWRRKGNQFYKKGELKRWERQKKLRNYKSLDYRTNVQHAHKTGPSNAIQKQLEHPGVLKSFPCAWAISRLFR